MTDGVIKANMTSNDAIETYARRSLRFSQRVFHRKTRNQIRLESPEL